MPAAIVLAVAGVILAGISLAGATSKRASQPNPVNGPVRVLSEVAR